MANNINSEIISKGYECGDYLFNETTWPMNLRIVPFENDVIFISWAAYFVFKWMPFDVNIAMDLINLSIRKELLDLMSYLLFFFHGRHKINSRCFSYNDTIFTKNVFYAPHRFNILSIILT